MDMINYTQRAMAFNRHFSKNANQDLDLIGFAKLLALIEEYISLDEINKFIEDSKKNNIA